jgi:N-acetylmuramoyl-L-alanine amidase
VILPTDNIVDNLSDLEVVARTAYGENRGGGHEGMQSVINVIYNRSCADGFPTTMRAVCLAPKQFDCWFPNTPDYIATIHALDTEPSMVIALELAQAALDDDLVDITDGATFYFASSMKQWPHWAIGHTPCATIAGQLFFNDIT